VPPEILARGVLALEAYNDALSVGTTCDRRVPVMLIGQYHSGKTSLKRSLKGEVFRPDENTTVGIDVDPAHFEVSTEFGRLEITVRNQMMTRPFLMNTMQPSLLCIV